MGVYENIQANIYKTKLPYPSRPLEPKLLRLRVSELTPEEIASIATVKADYEAAKMTYRELSDAYNADARLLDAQFRDDLEEEFGMKGHPKADILYSKAYEHGHSSGYSDIFSWYSDLHELVA